MKAHDFSTEAIHFERERESLAYREFISFTQAIICEYKLDLCIRSVAANEDSVARGRFISGLIGLYLDKHDASWPDFLATEMITSEDGRGVYLKSKDKKAIIGVANVFKEYAEGTGFTFTL